MSNTTITPLDARRKAERYCVYQDRCHDEVINKLKSMKIDYDEIDEIIVHLISHNFLNEERFARSFARGKHRIKSWGVVRITNELKARHISAPNIKLALTEISDEYETTFFNTSEKHWNSLTETNPQIKRKKFCDFLLRKGYESNRVYDILREFETAK